MWPACSLGVGQTPGFRMGIKGTQSPPTQGGGGLEKKGQVTQSPDVFTSLPFLLPTSGTLGIASRTFGKKLI